MQLSTKQLFFQPSKLKQTLTMKNESDDRVIYKVKLNNTEAFHIYPGKGFIAPHDALQMQISLKKYGDISGKLLLIYAFISNSQQSNFDLLWNSLEKNRLVNEMVEMSCAIPKTKETKFENNFKKVESSTSEHELLRSNHDKSQKSNQSNAEKQEIVQQIMLPKSMTVSSKTFNNWNKNQTEQEGKIQKKSKTTRNSCDIEISLKFQKEQNIKLKQRLLQNEKKLMYYEEIAQKDINNSIPSQNQQPSLNSLNVCLLMLVCLFFGFFLAKVKLNQAEV